MNNSTQLNDSFDCAFFRSWQKDISDNFIVICSPFTVTFNAFVIYVAVRYINFNQNLEQFFIVSMTVSDLMFGLVYMSTVKFALDLPVFLCRPYYILTWTFSIASVMFLLLLNLHKMFILFFPIRSFICLSKKKIIVQIVSCWTIILLTCSAFGFSPKVNLFVNPCHTCVVQVDYTFYSIMIFVYYISPLAVSTVISISIFIFAQNKLQKRRNAGNQDFRSFFRRIFFVFVSTLWTGVTCLPYRICLSQLLLCHYLCIDDTLKKKAFVFLGILTFGSVINPLLTLLVQEKYRERSLQIWRSLVNKI